MPNPNTNFKNSSGLDLGNVLITKEYLMTVYPQIANQLITPELWSWGRNSAGQLGDNTTTNRVTPVTTIGGGANWRQVSCSGVGNAITGAIKLDGTLWTWGWGQDGILGNNNGGSFAWPSPSTTFAGGTNWKQVSVSRSHSAAIKTDGTLWTWGLNSNGRLGDNTSSTRLTPVTTFAGGTNWKQVSCGCNPYDVFMGCTAAIKTDGTLWTWGRNAYGQLGDNTTTNRVTPVTTFAGGNNWKQVSCGGQFVSAIKTDGTLWGWGYNNLGQLGTNNTTNRPTPGTTFAGGTNWKQVSCEGGFSSSAIKTDGTLWVWGVNSGTLGTGSDVSIKLTPVTTFAGGTNWKQVSMGEGTTAAIKTDGTLWGWGRNAYGQLGTSSAITPICSPVIIFGGTNWKQISSNAVNMSAIRTSDDLQGI
jgi:alpha-tubulin suppressor-like RCC1 family protein